METQRPGADIRIVLWRALHPPVREARFGVIQAMRVVLATPHFAADGAVGARSEVPVAEVPIALAIVPVVYSALYFGLVGSAATSIWAVVLWLPCLAIPHFDGHPYNDLVSLSMVLVVGIVVGFRIESERVAMEHAHRATDELHSTEARYLQLFEANRAPILVLDAGGLVAEANPAARAVLGEGVVGRCAADVLGGAIGPATGPPRLIDLPDGREYRLQQVSVPTESGMQTQIVFEDVTAERREGRLATRYAQLVVQAEEDQRRRLARELHDEPLQLFLHLARRLESVAAMPGLTPAVAEDLERARRQSLEAAQRLRSLARDLRPPTLDQLGLVAAISSLVAEVEDEERVEAELRVEGEPVRLAPDVELGAFRIVQEAVRNSLNHAAARHLSVLVDYRGGDLAVTVSDDGRGFAVDGLGELGSHFGLVGMGERARLLGGELDLRSEPGRGTVIGLRLAACRAVGTPAPA